MAAFTLVVPITFAVLVVLFFVTLSYLEVIKVYTKAGGAYVVARDNFGPNVAQIAAVALLIDYTVTVAVSAAAGVAALTSRVPGAHPGTTVPSPSASWCSSPTATCAASARPARSSPSRPISSSPLVAAHRRRRRAGRPSASSTPTRSTSPGAVRHRPPRAAASSMGLACSSLLRAFATAGRR